MNVALKQFKVYVRGIVILGLASAIGLVFFKNRAHTVTFWFFGLTDDAHGINVIWLMLCTGAGTLASWWVFAMGWVLLRDMREVKRQRVLDRATSTLQQRAADLDERERRVDDKLKRALDDDDEAGE